MIELARSVEIRFNRPFTGDDEQNLQDFIMKFLRPLSITQIGSDFFICHGCGICGDTPENEVPYLNRKIQEELPKAKLTILSMGYAK